MLTFELHLEGCKGPVIWQPDDHTSGNTLPTPPRVVIYNEKVWQFYRFCEPKVPSFRGARYRRATWIQLAPGEYARVAK